MRLLSLIIPVLFISLQIVGQDTQHDVFRFDPDTLDRNYNGLTSYAFMFTDSSRSSTIGEIKEISFDQKVDFPKLDRIGGRFKYPVWIKVRLKPDSLLPKDSVILNVPFGFHYAVYEVSERESFKSIGGINSWKHPSQLDFCKFSFPLRILDTLPRDIYIKYEGFNSRNLSLHIASIEERKQFHEEVFFAKKGLIIYFVSLISSFFFLGLFFLVRYLIHSEKYILYYGLYLLCLSLALLYNLERAGELHIFWNRIAYSRDLNLLFTLVVFLPFGFYVKHMLNIIKGHPLYTNYKTLIYTLIYGIAVLSVVFLLYLFFNIRYSVSLVTIFTFLPASVAGLLFTIKLITQKGKINKLIGMGLTAVALACFIISIIMIAKLQCRYNLFLEIAYILEILFLTIAIGYKTKGTQRELLNTQKQLLHQEKQNLINQRKLNSELSRLVDEKTKDILTKNKALANQEKLKLEAEFRQKIANAELKALKAQMNPHFIFNCLNAIRNLVQKGKDELATEYLADFASFIRKALSYSEVKQITLDEELEICELYLKMEQLRFEDGFKFVIEVEPGTATDFIMLPPMILQPLLENSIWHGLLHKKEDRCLKIKIRQTEKQVICTIDDNGVGRAYSASLNGSSRKDSIGLKLFIDRLDINNKLLDNNYYYEIIDKYNNEVSAGTKVNLFFEI